MKKDIFYICIPEGEPKKIVAKKQVGYSEGDIGLHKGIGNIWVATHIPTGMKIVENKTRAGALERAKRLFTEKKDVIENSIKIHKESKAFESFLESQYEQSDTTVF